VKRFALLSGPHDRFRCQPWHALTLNDRELVLFGISCELERRHVIPDADAVFADIRGLSAERFPKKQSSFTALPVK
jgi:hypothetical protein